MSGALTKGLLFTELIGGNRAIVDGGRTAPGAALTCFGLKKPGEMLSPGELGVHKAEWAGRETRKRGGGGDRHKTPCEWLSAHGEKMLNCLSEIISPNDWA